MTGKGFIKTRNNLYPKKTMKKGPFRAKNACLPKIDPKHKRVMIPHVEVFSNTVNSDRKDITMAIIPQKSLFGWRDVEELGDLERLVLVLETMPDEKLVSTMEKDRFRGRNDYPVRAVWNAMLAGMVYQHPTVASLLRELKRNAQLREVCGFDLFLGIDAVPTQWAFSRFLKRLSTKYADYVEQMFDELVAEVIHLLPDFGSNLAIDGKAIQSFAKRESKKKPDGRRDVDANWGKQVYKGINKDGGLWEKVVSWFGYRLHLIVDSTYELPVHYRVTRASNPEVKEAHGMIEDLNTTHPTLLRRCEKFTGDRGFDDTKLIVKLWDTYGIKPVIDIRNMWQDPDDTRLLGDHSNVCYDYKGTVYCYCPASPKKVEREMPYGGFEKDRGTLKYRCPAQHYGITCRGIKSCPVASGIRIKLEDDRRVFTPLARSSYAWKRAYKKRTSVERVNSRLDVFFNFENHTVRGLAKMKVRCGLALCIMLAMAVGRIKQKRPELMRSLISSA
jgi:hypothetical protein